jgi:hypothetical protein
MSVVRGQRTSCEFYRYVLVSKLFNVGSLATGMVGLDLVEAVLGIHSVGKGISAATCLV